MNYIQRSLKKLLLVFLVIGLPVFAAAEIKVIVHPSNNSALDTSDIEKLFLGKKKSFPNGESATLFSLTGNDATTEDFLNNVVGKSGAQFNSFWAKLVFTGKGTPPKEVASDAEMVNSVSGNPGAIGFVSSQADTSTVKVIGTF